MAIVRWICLLATLVGISAAPSFHHGHSVGVIDSNSIGEASGLCASRQYSDILYTHNDSGGWPRIFAIDANSGHLRATINIHGAKSHDWEDIACGPCTNGIGSCIYIADTGGNTGSESNYIYRIREPDDIRTQTVNVDGTLHFGWDQHDCETIMVDNHGEVYVVSKVNHGHGKVVHLPRSAWDTGRSEYVSSGTHLSISSNSYAPVGGDISRDGTEVLLKTYGHVYYWHVTNNDYLNALTRQPETLPYHPERQGEAVCWDSVGRNYYTTSEGFHQPLYFYQRY